MAFRANEDAGRIFDEIVRYFTRNLDREQKDAAIQKLLEISNYSGYAVDAYPSWHPLVAIAASIEDNGPATPERCSAYKGLDHTRYFANAFITCPYAHATEEVIDSVESLPSSPDCKIEAEVLDIKLYSTESPPILVSCKWSEPLNLVGTIPKNLAIPLMLEDMLRQWRSATRGETWESMQPYLLGQPHGSLSSLFVDQKTGQAMKTIYNNLVYSGAFGPLKV